MLKKLKKKCANPSRHLDLFEKLMGSGFILHPCFGETGMVEKDYPWRRW